MSASYFSDVKNGALHREPVSRDIRDPLEDKMDQIRELLFGEFKRENDARFALVEARVRELEVGLHRKLDTIQARIETLSGDLKTDRKAAFDELSGSVTELAERIRQIAR